MQSNFKLEQQISNSMMPLIVFILTSLLISACGGGISGTGDGGPIVVSPGETNSIVDTDGADDTIADNGSDNSTTNAGDVDGGVDNSGDISSNPEPSSIPAPTESDAEIQSPDVSQPLTEALRLLPSEIVTTSIAQPFVAQLNIFQQELSVALQATSATQGMAQGVAVENISDSFETTLRYNIDNTQTVIASNRASTTRYLFSTNAERAIYLFQQGEILTARHLNRNTNSLLQVTIIPTSNNTTVIEADLNQNGSQIYLQLQATASTTIVFAQHPTNSAIARQREIISESGSTSTVQNCISASQNCDLDRNWSNADPLTDTQFAAASTSIKDSLDDITSPVTVLPEGINEVVLTQQTSNTPTDEQIQCGIQRVTGSLRAFCVLPQPLGQTSLFRESLAGGEVFYQLLE